MRILENYQVKIKHPLILISIFWGSLIPLFAQTQIQPFFKHFTTNHGLPHQVGFDILHHSDGFIWIGTDDGLARFDGSEFKLFNESDGLTNPYVIALGEREDGSILIGTNGGGLHFLKGNEILKPDSTDNRKVLKIEPISNDYFLIEEASPTLFRLTLEDLNTRSKRNIYFEKEGETIVAYYEILHKDLDENQKNETLNDKGFRNWMMKIREKMIFADLDILDWCVWEERQVVIVTNHGVFKIPIFPNEEELDVLFQKGENRFTRMPKNFSNLMEAPELFAVDKDKNGDLWFGGKGQIVNLKPDNSITAYQEGIPKKKIDDLVVIESSIFFSTGTKEELYLYDWKNNNCQALNKALGIEASLSMLKKDRHQNCWISTHGDGLYCIHPNYFETISIENGLSNNYIHDIEEAPSGTIFVANMKGLDMYSKGNWRPNPWLINKNIAGGLVKNSLGNIYSTFNSPAIIHRIFEDAAALSTGIRGYPITGDALGNIWSSGSFRPSYMEDSLLRTQYANEQFEPYIPAQWRDFLIKKNWITSSGTFAVLQGQDSILYIGFQKGLLELQSDSLVHFTEKQGLINNRINDLKQDDSGMIWIATEGGLSKYQHGTFQNFTIENGLASNKCRQILLDDFNNLWIATPKGLHYFDQQQFFIFNSNEGLPADDVTCLFESSNNQLWIGTSGGIAIFDKNQPLRLSKSPKVYIQNVEINGASIDLEQVSNIPFNHPMTIQYSCIAFQNPKDITFQFRLNQSDEWNEHPNRSVFFQNLSEGAYHFELRAKLLNSEWSEPIGFQFTIQPPWWKRQSFFLAMGLSIGLLVGGIVWWRQGIIRRNESKLLRIKNKLARLELKALQAQMNPHFIFNALNAIMSFVLNEDKLQANLYLSKFALLMRKFLEASKSNYISLAEELALIDLYVELEKLRYKNSFEYRVQMDADLDIDYLEIPSMLIQPFVENAINHGLAAKKENGILELTVKFHAKENLLKMVIQDNGIGRDEAARRKKASLHQHKSAGTQIISERVKTLNSVENVKIQIQTIDLQDEHGKAAGTAVEIIIPI